LAIDLDVKGAIDWVTDFLPAEKVLDILSAAIPWCFGASLKKPLDFST
jgi:hypothetical protein